MTTVPTLHLQEHPAGGEPSVWIRGTIDRQWALELFTNLVHADAVSERRFGPDTGHRLVLLADRPGELHAENTRPVVVGSYMRRRVEELAVDVERGAAALEREAADMTGRGEPTDRPGVAVRKLAAARDLRAYAAALRTGTGEVNAREAQKLARAGQCGGILLDSQNHPMPEDDKAVLDALVDQGHMVRVVDIGSPFYALASYGGWYTTPVGGAR